MKILIPVDGSVYSDNAVAFVASRTTLIGHEPHIVLLNVQAPLPARASRLVSRLWHRYLRTIMQEKTTRHLSIL